MTPFHPHKAPLAPIEAHLLGTAEANLCGVIADLDRYAQLNELTAGGRRIRTIASLLEALREQIVAVADSSRSTMDTTSDGAS